MAEDTPPGSTDAPDPRTATDIAMFVELLRRLRTRAGNPGYKKTLERATRDEHGIPRISGSTLHRVLEGHQDLARMRDPDVFVRELVTALGANPRPWSEALDRLLHPATPEPPVEPATDTTPVRRTRRGLLAVTAAVLLVAAGVVVWSTAGPHEPPAAPPTGPVRLSISLAADPALSLAVDPTADPSVTHTILADDAAGTGWEMVAPYHAGPRSWQLRASGRLLSCLEVLGAGYAEGTLVQQYGCNGRPHQHWTPEPQEDGTLRWINFHSEQCLTAAGTRPRAGTELVQRECDPARAALQQWRVTTIDTPLPPTVPNSVVPGRPGPGPTDYPGGGKDHPCHGVGPALDPRATAWAAQPSPVGGQDPGGGRVSMGPDTAGAVELMHATRTTDTGDHTFYWAEGWIAFSPHLFTMSLQWTTAPGSGDWHTCTVPFTTEHGAHGRPATTALPRSPDGTGHLAFRTCITYTPELEPREPMINCSGRH
ncbi:RICIN domain-containing protein [Actinosynnema sp. NPDC047251]|uniref:RICIN domain-containing protein n=1 Tax=Saccharothrix espanaensis TaxID=103731 RepID=UPI0003080D12|nr:RICIN domain-containing protein [Saccharothrix espanaensis]